MPTDANKIVLAILMAWYFLIRFHYQSIARLTHPVQADIPLSDRLLNASTRRRGVIAVSRMSQERATATTMAYSTERVAL